MIKYEDKNYYCKNHIKEMKHYCFQCQKNLCDGCKESHVKNEKYKGHQIKTIDSLIPKEQEINNLKNSLEEIENNLSELKDVINNLTYTMNGAMRLYQNYCKIAKFIIKKYETFNIGEKAFKNFTIFKCLRNLKFSNKEILDDLISIINAKDKITKASTLIQYYTDKKDKYYKNKSGTDLNKESDDEWLQEVLKREKGEIETIEDKKEEKKEKTEDKKEEKVKEEKIEKKEDKKRENEEHKGREKEKEDYKKKEKDEEKKKEKIEDKKEEKKGDKNEETTEDKKEEKEQNKKRDVKRKKSKTKTLDARKNNYDEN